MIVKRHNPFGTPYEREMDIPNLTEEQLEEWAQGGKLIQHALPHLTPDEREFIISGTLPHEWDQMREPDE